MSSCLDLREREKRGRTVVNEVGSDVDILSQGGSVNIDSEVVEVSNPLSSERRWRKGRGQRTIQGRRGKEEGRVPVGLVCDRVEDRERVVLALVVGVGGS